MTNNIFQFSLRTKISIAFVLVLLDTTGIDLLAIERLQGVSALAADLQTNWLPATRAIDDTATLDASEVKHQPQLFEQAYKQYQPTIAPGEESGLAGSIVKAWQHYSAMGGTGVIIGWLIIRVVAIPIGKMMVAMRRIADCDMLTEIPGVGRSDEIGRMADAFQVFKDNMIRADHQSPRRRASAPDMALA